MSTTTLTPQNKLSILAKAGQSWYVAGTFEQVGSTFIDRSILITPLDKDVIYFFRVAGDKQVRFQVHYDATYTAGTGVVLTPNNHNGSYQGINTPESILRTGVTIVTTGTLQSTFRSGSTQGNFSQGGSKEQSIPIILPRGNRIILFTTQSFENTNNVNFGADWFEERT